MKKYKLIYYNLETKRIGRRTLKVREGWEDVAMRAMEKLLFAEHPWKIEVLGTLYAEDGPHPQWYGFNYNSMNDLQMDLEDWGCTQRITIDTLWGTYSQASRSSTMTPKSSCWQGASDDC